jgi:hypothetical protein
MKYINNCKIVDKLENIILLTVIFISFFISSSNAQAATISNDKTLNSKIGWTIDGKKLK